MQERVTDGDALRQAQRAYRGPTIPVAADPPALVLVERCLEQAVERAQEVASRADRIANALLGFEPEGAASLLATEERAVKEPGYAQRVGALVGDLDGPLSRIELALRRIDEGLGVAHG